MGRKFTEEDAKRYLMSLSEFAEENHKRLVQIMELRAVAESCTVRTDKENIQTSAAGDKMSNIVGRIVDIEREIYKTNKIIEHRRAEFEEITKNMSHDRHREYLTVRYYDGNGFYDTAMIMDMRDSAVKKIHRKSIAEFTKIYNDKHNI